MVTTSPNQTGTNARLLIVGRNEIETRNLADALAADYPISAAPAVQEAIQRLQKEAFSVILFDLADDESSLVAGIENLQEYAPATPIIVW